jgi:hypothetical protein
VGRYDILGKAVRSIKRGLVGDACEERCCEDIDKGEKECRDRKDDSFDIGDSLSERNQLHMRKRRTDHSPNPPPKLLSSTLSPHSITSIPISFASRRTLVVFPVPAGPVNNIILCHPNQSSTHVV